MIPLFKLGKDSLMLNAFTKNKYFGEHKDFDSHFSTMSIKLSGSILFITNVFYYIRSSRSVSH